VITQSWINLSALSGCVLTARLAVRQIQKSQRLNTLVFLCPLGGKRCAEKSAQTMKVEAAKYVRFESWSVICFGIFTCLRINSPC